MVLHSSLRLVSRSGVGTFAGAAGGRPRRGRGGGGGGGGGAARLAESGRGRPRRDQHEDDQAGGAAPPPPPPARRLRSRLHHACWTPARAPTWPLLRPTPTPAEKAELVPILAA